MEGRMGKPGVFITGACGYIGNLLVKAMASMRDRFGPILASDIRKVKVREDRSITRLALDVRSEEMEGILRQNGITTVVHLAGIVTPGKKHGCDLAYQVDVLGTKNVLQSCLKAGVNHLIVTSSGAAYGYHANNPDWLDEQDPLRGDPEFAYADHKRQVEEMLLRAREEHPELKQLILRPGTILGVTTSNQITDLFQKKVILGVRGSTTPFVFIWDKDVVAVIIKGILEGKTGIYNLAGDGVMELTEIADILKKPLLRPPAWILQSSLFVLKRFGLTQYGPEQVNFLRYRPVLSNRRLKEEFGYTPQKTTRQVFEYYLQENGLGPSTAELS
jgi:UDP-glucose 4-epimerase